MGTTAPLQDPTNPGAAAAILGISGRIVQEHYNRAGQAETAARFHVGIREDRKRTESLARREFVKNRRKGI